MSDIVRPIEPFELTQGFGSNPDTYKRFGLKGHNGWDLKTKFPDTPKGFRNILSSWLMLFYKQGNEGKDGYGLYFETLSKLYSTWKLTFAHCLSVESFTTKNEGENMAISDNTGFSTDSHLHLTTKRIRIINGQHEVIDYNNGYFGAVNPQDFFDELRKYKKAGLKPQLPKDDTQMTIDQDLYKHLVDGATVRKELAIYLEIDDPDHTPLERFKSFIAGLKSRLTDLEKQVENERTEKENRIQQVSRLEEEVLQEQKAKNELSDQYNKALKNVGEIESVYKGQLITKQGVIDEQGKQLGDKNHEISQLQLELKKCKEGSSSLTLWTTLMLIKDKIFKFLKTTKLQG